MSNIKQNHGWRSEITVFHNLIEEHISLNVIGLSVCYKRLQQTMHSTLCESENKHLCKQLRQTLLFVFLVLRINKLNNLILYISY